MISSSLRSIVLAGALMGAGIVGPAGTALARTSYDGNWSVLIVTHSGACERALRYPVQISNGNVLSEGGSASLQGRVAPSGAVRVSVSAGTDRKRPVTLSDGSFAERTSQMIAGLRDAESEAAE